MISPPRSTTQRRNDSAEPVAPANAVGRSGFVFEDLGLFISLCRVAELGRSAEFQSCHAHRKALVSRLWTFKAFVRLCIDNRLSRLQFD